MNKLDYTTIPPDQILLAEHYKMAMDSQNACNLSGIVKAFAQVTEELWKEAHHYKLGTDFVNQHPISRLFAEQIAHLAGAGPTYNSQTYHEAHNFVTARIQVLTSKEPRELFAQMCGSYIAIWDCAKPGMGEPLAILDIDPFPMSRIETVIELEKKLNGVITNFNKEDGRFYL